jgi:hypothetical protein
VEVEMTVLAKIEQQELVTRDPYAPSDFNGAFRLAEIVCDSRLAPNLDTPEKAFVVLATGNELGLSPMQSIRGIHIIEGRPSPSADTLAAVVLASGKAEYFEEVETTDAHSTWKTKRVSRPERKYTFSLKDAEKAGLIHKTKSGGDGMWMKYPKRMMAARAKAFLARDVYPDLVLGLYTPEELTDGKDEVELQSPTPTHPPKQAKVQPVVRIVEQVDPTPTPPTAQAVERVPTPTPPTAQEPIDPDAPMSDCDRMVTALRDASSMPALAKIAGEIGDMKGTLTPDELAIIKDEYKAASARIKAGQ